MKKNQGFSLVEVIVVISIIAVLATIIAPNVIRQTEKAQESKALQEAQVIYDAAKLAVVNAKLEKKEAFIYAVKFGVDLNGDGDNTDVRYGRCTNQSLFKYLNARSDAGTGATYQQIENIFKSGVGIYSDAKSSPVDCYICHQLAGSIPGLKEGMTAADSPMRNQAPLGKSVSIMDEDTYGKVVFALAYNSSGQVVYFQCLYNGYFIQFDENGDATIEAAESQVFNDWPKDRLPDASGW